MLKGEHNAHHNSRLECNRSSICARLCATGHLLHMKKAEDFPFLFLGNGASFTRVRTMTLELPDFLRLSTEERARHWEGFVFKNPKIENKTFNKPPKPKVVKLQPKKKVYPQIDTSGKRWDGFKGKWVDENPFATSASVTHLSPPAPIATRSTIELDAIIRVIKPNNPRIAGTKAYDRFQIMKAYVAAHPGCTVGDVLTNTSYRKDDYAWDLKKRNVT